MLIIGLLVDLAISECLHSRMHKNLLGEGLGSAYLRGEDARVFRSPAENAEASGEGGAPHQLLDSCQASSQTLSGG